MQQAMQSDACSNTGAVYTKCQADRCFALITLNLVARRSSSSLAVL